MNNAIQIPGYPNYLIDRQGNVYRVACNRGHKHKNPVPIKIAQYKTSSGYLAVSLWTGCKQRSCLVHRLVLLTFVGPQLKGMEGMHKNGISVDNKISNLKWGTHLENIHHKKIHGTELIGSRHPNSKLTENAVLEIRNLLMNDNITLTAIGKKYGVLRQTIAQIKKGLTWNHLGPISDMPKSKPGRRRKIGGGEGLPEQDNMTKREERKHAVVCSL